MVGLDEGGQQLEGQHWGVGVDQPLPGGENPHLGRGLGERLAPGAFALSGRDVLVGAADGTVLLKTVQPAGKGAMAAADWWRGLRGIPRAALLSEPASSLPEAGAR